MSRHVRETADLDCEAREVFSLWACIGEKLKWEHPRDHNHRDSQKYWEVYCDAHGSCDTHRRRTNLQQLTCKIDLSNSFCYLFFSFVLIELKPVVLKGKVLGEKF